MGPTSKPLGELCLNFANTLDWHASDNPTETLTGYADLVAWARKFEVLAPQEADQLLKTAQSAGEESKSTLERAVLLREAIYRIILSHLGGRSPAADDLRLLNRELERAHRHMQVSFTENGYQLVWTEEGGHLDRPLWQVARSAAELLTGELISRVGQCADDRGCGYLFIDWSKNHSRRWCDINDCGNRAKQRRFYREHKTASTGTQTI